MRLKTLCGLALTAVFAACGGGSGNQGATIVPSQPGGTSPATISPSTPTGNAKTITITEYSLGQTPSDGGIAIAKDGSVWTESNGPNANATFVRWNNGTTASYPIPNPNAPFQSFLSAGSVIASGSNIYAFATQDQGGGNSVEQAFTISDAGGSVTSAGGMVVNGGGIYGQVVSSTVTNDGNVWEAVSYPQYGCCSGQGNLYQLSPGTAQISLPSGSNKAGFVYDLPTAVAAGPDGNLWVGVSEMQNADNQSITTIATQILVYSKSGSLLHTFTVTSAPNAMGSGPDSALWFTLGNGSVGRMTTGGSVTYYPSHTTTALTGITVGSDGALWFLEPNINRLGRMTISGAATDYAIPTSGSNPQGIIGASNGCQPYTLWFAEAGSGKIAVVGLH